MRGGKLGSIIYFLAYLLYYVGVKADDSHKVAATRNGDQQHVELNSDSDAAAAELVDADERSSAFAHSVSNRGSTKSLAQATGDASANGRGLSQTYGGYRVPTPYNQYGQPPTGYGPGFTRAQAEANDLDTSYPGYLRSSVSAPAEAFTNSGSAGHRSSLYPGPSYSKSPVSSLKEAQANTGRSGHPSSAYPIPALSEGGFSYENSASALADAQAYAGSAGNLSPAYPGYLHRPSGSSAQAEANAGQFEYPNYPETQSSSSGLASDSALAEALATSQSGNPHLLSYPLAKNPSGSSASALAEANADAQGGQGYPYEGPSDQANGEAEAKAYEMGLATNGDAPPDHATSRSRLISTEELIPGNPSINCEYAGQLYYYWSNQYQCSVCACVSEYGLLKPVCASCAGCMRPQPLSPPWPPLPWSTTPSPWQQTTPPPYPTPVPTPTAPMRPPESQVATCDPLPTNKPFQNPLNPCQICICKHTFNKFGKPDVNIVCKENTQCVIPPDVTELPPTPKPTPQPLCERFPLNVWFPHPNEVCKVCQCTIQNSHVTSRPEYLINCVTNPSCGETPVHPRPPFPPTPQQILPPTTPRPFSWAPTPKQPQSPLPGPKPHESCRPFHPNVPFDHPWDSCQLCVCSEAFKVGFVNVEVNCYTKKECCIESPYEQLPLSGKTVVMTCQPPYPLLYQPYAGQPGIGSSSASAHATAEANSGSYHTYPVPNPNQSNYPIEGPPRTSGLTYPNGPFYSGKGTEASASALAEAASNSIQSGYPWYHSGEQPGFGPEFQPGHSQGDVLSAQPIGQAEANGFLSGFYPGKELYQPEFKSAKWQVPAEASASQHRLQAGADSSARSNAETAANAYGNGESTETQAQAEPNSNLYGLRASPYPEAEAQAAASQFEPRRPYFAVKPAAQAQDQTESNQYGSGARPYSAKAGVEAAAYQFGAGNSHSTAQHTAQTQVQEEKNQQGSRTSPYSASNAQAGNQFRAVSPYVAPQAETNVNLYGLRARPYSKPGAEELATQFGARSPYSAAQPAPQAQIQVESNRYGSRARPYSQVGLETGVPANQLGASDHFSAARNQAEATAGQFGPAQSQSAAQAQSEANGNQLREDGEKSSFKKSVATADENAATTSQIDPFAYDLNNGYEAIPVALGDVTSSTEDTVAAKAARGRLSGPENIHLLNSVPASALYPKLYPRPSSHVTPLHVPPGLREGDEHQALSHGSHAPLAGVEQALVDAESSHVKTGERCAYDGDKYEHHCQACECHSGPDGVLVALCSGATCSHR